MRALYIGRFQPLHNGHVEAIKYIIQEVDALRNTGGTEELRKVISGLADDLENRLNTLSASNRDAVPLVNPMRTLSILMDLYFSL